MAGRISELVNAALADEGEGVHLPTSEILDLIDLGRSEGGSEVCLSLQVVEHQGFRAHRSAN